MNIDDPRLTAYALDELDEAERAAIADEVAASPEAQREIQETQTMARLLRKEFATELSNEAPLRANLSDIRDDPWFWSIARPLAIAAVIAVCALVASIAVVSLKRPHFQNEQRIVVTGNNIPAAPEETRRNPQFAEVERSEERRVGERD